MARASNYRQVPFLVEDHVAGTGADIVYVIEERVVPRLAAAILKSSRVIAILGAYGDNETKTCDGSPLVKEGQDPLRHRL